MPEPDPLPVRTDGSGSKPDLSPMAPHEPSADGDAERPTYQGEWAKATGQQRQAHMQAVAAWKKAQGHKPTPQASSGRNGTVEPSARQHTDTLEADASANADASASLEALRSIRDDKKALRSDRIRAAEALLRSSGAQASSATDEVALWMAMRTTLEAIPPGDALSWLLGELGEEASTTARSLEGEETRA